MAYKDSDGDKHMGKKAHSMGGKGSKAHHGGQMTKKEYGFGAHLGKMHKKGKGPEGPHMGMKGAI